MTDTQSQAETQIPITPEVARQLVLGIAGENLQNLSPTVKGALDAFKNGQAEKALQMIAGEVIPFSEGDANRTLTENLSSQRDPDTGEKKAPKSGPEKKRYEETKETAQAVREYLTDPKGEIPNKLLEITYGYLLTNPTLRELIVDTNGKIDPTKAEPIAKALLRQPQVRQEIRRLYCQYLDPAKRLEHEKEVLQLDQEIQGILAELGEDIDQLIEDKIKEIITLDAKIKQDSRYRTYQEMLDQIDSLTEERNYLSNLIAELKGLMPPQATALDPLLADKITTYSNRINQINQDINTLQQKKTAFEGDKQNRSLFTNLQRLSQLQQELQSLEQKRSAIDPEKRRKLQAELAEKQAELAEARSLLLAEQIKYAGEIQAIVPNALKTYLDEGLTLAANNYREQAKKEAQQKEERLGWIVDKIASRFGKKLKTKGGMEMWVADRKTSQSLLQKLLLPDGADKLFDPINGELRLDKDHLKNTYGLTDEEADILIEKLTEDPQYQRQLASRLAQEVFADYIGQGGRLSQDIVVALTSTTWGKQLLDEGQNLINNRRQQLENILGKGIISRVDEIKGKSKEGIKGNWKTAGLVILLILLLGLGIPLLKAKG